jgi:hypothetical protein
LLSRSIEGGDDDERHGFWLWGVGAKVTAGDGLAAGVHPDAIARAHQALLAQHDLQFDFSVPPVVTPPDWLKQLISAIGHGIAALGPAFKFIFWAGLAAVAVALLIFVLRDVAGLRGFWPKKRARDTSADHSAEWRPAAARARTLLADADRLAAEGRYDEAAHLLLVRSIEDIDQRWPNLVRPALTSRDIAAHEGLPQAARTTFAGLAQVVERSLFGGAPVGASDFAACRRAYAAFALPGQP